MATSLPTDSAKCGGMFLFGPEPNGPPLKKIGKTNAGADGSLQNQSRIRGPGKGVLVCESREGECKRPRPRTSGWRLPGPFIGMSIAEKG
ncbi:hypothetical protein Taro_042861 [Colocasia esculenta]|uniref:Uncharacterized protein n=1 Tax=Colocasia esculenta TaxID=4460 RepID=A0A843X0D2_COLES|nr:hypothetical protein [Colocasia esculenta]